MKDTTTSYEDFVAARRKYFGGSDASSVVNAGKYGCQRKLIYDKSGAPKDIDDGDKMEFRRGRRLESVAAEYYVEKTGRRLRLSSTAFVPGKKHLAVNADRLVSAEGREDSGYLEIKVIGRHSYLNIKKNGIPDDWALQLQWGLSVMDRSWGSFALYVPDMDHLEWFDQEADKALGELLLEKGDDLWSIGIDCGVIPDPLPEGARACESCPWSVTCRGSLVKEALPGITDRPDLEPLIAKYAEVKGMDSEVSDAAESIRAEILEAIKETPGVYRAGRFEFPFTVREQRRFSSEKIKKLNPALYEQCREPQIIKTLGKPKEF